MFSRRTSWPREENTLTRAQPGAIDLSASNPTTLGFAPPPDVLAAFSLAAAARYEPSAFGLASARRAVADSYARRGAVIDPDRIALTASTSEAYHALFAVLCDPGDRVLVPSPSYPLFSFIADVAAVELVPYPLRYDGEWHTDFNGLAIDSRTRAVIIVSPNNPTGHYLKRDEHARFAELGLPLIVDEVFADYPLDAAAPHRHLTHDTRALTFSLAGLSKSALLPQAKLSWCVASGPNDLVREALARLELVLDAFLSVSGPVQHAAPALLAYAETVQPRVRERLATNLATLRRALTGSAATVLRCEGGFSAIVRLPNVHDEDAWCERLRDRSVLVQPGWFFDLPFQPCVVVSLLVEPERFAAAAETLSSSAR